MPTYRNHFISRFEFAAPAYRSRTRSGSRGDAPATVTSREWAFADALGYL